MSEKTEKGVKDFTSQELLDANWKDSDDEEDFCGNESKVKLDEKPSD